MKELADILRKRRMAAGSIDFNAPEAELRWTKRAGL